MRTSKRIEVFLLSIWYWFLRVTGLGYAKPTPYWLSRTFTPTEISRQQRCRHLKGALGYPRGPRVDFNISLHTFIDGRKRIKCLSCGWEVWNLPEFRFKWAEGMKMVNCSSNTPSSSEVMLNPKPNGKVELGNPHAVAPKTTYDPFVFGQPDNPIKGAKHKEEKS
jgi:hypothetical protein